MVSAGRHNRGSDLIFVFFFFLSLFCLFCLILFEFIEKEKLSWGGI